MMGLDGWTFIILLITSVFIVTAITKVFSLINKRMKERHGRKEIT